MAKLAKFCEENQFEEIYFLQNNSYLVENKLAKQISCEDISNVIQQGNKFI